MKKTWMQKVLAALSKPTSGKDKDLRYAFCAKSFFPEVLPPIFSSRLYADLMFLKEPNGKFIADFSGKKPKVYLSELDTYIFRRPANQRRNFGVVHPVSFHALVNEVSKNWATLHALSQSECSASAPQVEPILNSDSAIQPKVSRIIERDKKLDIRSRAKYLIKTDITRFYPSIYTHSISWAIDGKSNAKANKQDYTLLGNKIDILCRNTQGSQTLGVSIGQDVFRVCAEVILSDIDKKVNLTNKNCYRYSDDYEIACATYDEAENIIAKLERSLHDYGLALNHSKTKIITLPHRIEDNWISKFGGLEASRYDSEAPAAQLSKIVRLFDVAFDISNDYPTSPALSYAIALLPGFKTADSDFVATENASTIEKYLAHAIVIEPGCLSRALRYKAMLSKVKGNEIMPDGFRESLEQVLKSGIRLGIDSDIAWAIFGHILFGYKISDTIGVEEVISSSRSIVHALMIGAYVKNIWKFDIESMKNYVSNKGTNSSEWLTIYELARYGICEKSKQKINGSAEMKYLLDNDVSFIDMKADHVADILKKPLAESVSYDEAKGY